MITIKDAEYLEDDTLPDYCVVSLFYNQHDRLKLMEKTWESQAHPPKKIIIMDDGSEKPLDVSWAKVIRMEHSANLSRLLNEGFKHVDTQFYTETSPDFLYTRNFGAMSVTLLKALGRKSFPVGFLGAIKTIPSKGTVHAFPKFTYGKNGATIPRSPEDCLRGWMQYTEDNLFYNEGFCGWGKYDDDYVDRCVKAGYKWFCYDNFGFWHVAHHLDQAFLKKNLVNEQKYKKYMDYYTKNKITKLDEKMRRGEFA